jgi:hypothetical protein
MDTTAAFLDGSAQFLGAIGMMGLTIGMIGFAFTLMRILVHLDPPKGGMDL